MVDRQLDAWAGLLDGQVIAEDTWHSVIDAVGEWRIGVQLAPGHVPPGWPGGPPQQVHLDLHVEDPRAAHQQAVALGARLLQPARQADNSGDCSGHSQNR